MHLFNHHTTSMYDAGALQVLADFTGGALERRYEVSDDPESLDRYLEEQGVEKAIMLGSDSRCTGTLPNEYVADFCARSKKLKAFAVINPLQVVDPAATLEYCVKELGMRGLKLSPSYNLFYPNDPLVYPLYEKCVELNLPVMYHIGSSYFRGTKLRYADPLHLDDVARDFPELVIIMAHSGRGCFYDRAYFLSRLHDNVYMEVSGLPPKKLLDFFPELEKNADKVLFGTDWPTVPAEVGENIRAIQELPLSDRAIEKILYGNAERLLQERLRVWQ